MSFDMDSLNESTHEHSFVAGWDLKPSEHENYTEHLIHVLDVDNGELFMSQFTLSGWSRFESTRDAAKGMPEPVLFALKNASSHVSNESSDSNRATFINNCCEYLAHSETAKSAASQLRMCRFNGVISFWRLNDGSFMIRPSYFLSKDIPTPRHTLARIYTSLRIDAVNHLNLFSENAKRQVGLHTGDDALLHLSH